MFAAIRERYGIDRDDTLKLRDYPTLRHVVGFVEDRAGSQPAPARAAPGRRRARAEPRRGDRAGATPRRRRRGHGAVLAIVAAQTGYPADMLDPDLDLEADLGIDTVKQAEVFAAIRERYGIDATTPSSSATTPPSATSSASSKTARRRTRPAPAAPAARARTAAAPSRADDDRAAAVLEIVAAQTGYPADMLDLDLDLEADLGIDTVKQAEMFAAIRERYGIDRDDTLKLRDYPTLRHVVGFVEDRAGAVASAPAERRAGARTRGGDRHERGVPAPRAGRRCSGPRSSSACRHRRSCWVRAAA